MHKKEILCCLIKYCLIKYLQILNNFPFILNFRSALTLICSYSEENKAYFWNSNLGLPEEEICLQVSRNVMVAHSSHFYFMICGKIHINQSKIFYSWWSILAQAKWEQSKYKCVYHLQADKAISFPCNNWSSPSESEKSKTRRGAPSLTGTDWCSCLGREFPKFLWDEV